MSLGADRPEFAPPPQRGTPRAVLLALIAHALLIIALTWGVNWKRDTEDAAVEAELWSSTVQQAAPRLSTPPAPTPPTPAPTPAPPPPPPPPPQVRAPEPAPPPPRTPDIALEREKKLKEQKEREREEQLAQQQQKKKLEAAKKAAEEKKEREARERAEDEAERKKEQQEKLAEAKKKQEAEAAKKKEAEAKATAQAAADRAATLKRMQGLAGASGSDTATGTALRSSGPSGSYGGKVAAAVRPNVVFPDAELVSGNPGAEFDVRLAPDGTIVGTPALVKTSGLPNWDEAALRALQKTEKLPRDIDGTVPPRLIVTLRPKR
ncbi:cell envelope integrity protein TolA [Variovorax paradoxus]|nr:cell envelope integrity protein TolA [Variovorax paradoxus]